MDEGSYYKKMYDIAGKYYCEKYINKNEIDVIIEIPYNTFIKYEFDEVIGKMRCDRILNTSMLYPGNYGYIPNTLAGDGDPLDILLVCDYPIYPGIVVKSKIIGVLIMEDEKGIDEKIITVPAADVDINYKDINELKDLPKVTVSKIKHFFEHYKDNETEKWCQVKEYEDSEKAINLVEKYKKLIS